MPLDYSKPNGTMISLGLLKVGALDPARRIGSLIMNPGGPGDSGMLQAVGLPARSPTPTWPPGSTWSG